ncbi:TPA: hypothetical protein ACPJ17_002230 [Vibrio alginolyticus]
MYNSFVRAINKTTVPILVCISLLSTTYIYIYSINYGEEYLCLLPFVYGLFSISLYAGVSFTKKSIFIQVLTLVGFFRYIVHPVLTVYLGGYEGRSSLAPDEGDYISAIYLMSYELICVAIIIAIFEYKNRYKPFLLSSDFRVAFGIKASSILLITSVFLLFISPKSILLISFVIPNPVQMAEEDVSSMVRLFAFIFIITKTIFVINVMYYVKLKDSKVQSKKYQVVVLLSIIIGMLIYMGTNRTDILVNAVILLLFAYKLFGKPIIKMAVLGAVIVPMILVAVTKHREYVVQDDSKLANINDYTQVYFGGVYNVAVGLGIEKNFPEASSFSVLAYDILRPMVGVNILVKSWNLKYSNMYYNDRIWRHVDRRSQIIPMIAQGNLFFGKVLSPILTILFVMIGYYFIGMSNKNISLELKFIITLILARLGFVFGQNTMNFVNDISMNLFIFLALLSFIKILKTKKHEKSGFYSRP